MVRIFDLSVWGVGRWSSAIHCKKKCQK
jgi:hypothetical protein